MALQVHLDIREACRFLTIFVVPCLTASAQTSPCGSARVVPQNVICCDGHMVATTGCQGDKTTSNGQ